MDPGSHLDGGERLGIGGSGCHMSDQSGLASEGAEALPQHLGDLVLSVRQVTLAVEQGDQDITQTGQSHGTAGRLPGRRSRSRGADGLATAQVKQMEARSASSHPSRSVLTGIRGSTGSPIDAVLIDVKGVEQMRETRVRRT